MKAYRLTLLFLYCIIINPAFIQEEWAEEIRRNVAPMIIKAHLQGDLKTLRPWLGEAVMGKLSADIRIVTT